MKRIPNDPENFGALALYDAIGRKHGFDLGDDTSSDKFLGRVGKLLRQNRSDPILVHGQRVQSMFGYVAASMGKCAVIKQEDSGELYAVDTGLRIPDYRIVLDSGDRFFVEVKNCNKARPSRRLPFREDYLSGLEGYASAFASSVKIAVYWSRWHAWTLVSSDKLPMVDGKRGINFLEAFKINEMATLGDMSIATTPPLTIRIVTDPGKPRTIQEDGKAPITIGGVQVLCDGKKIEDDTERDIAYYLMQYGEWPDSEPEWIVHNGELLAFDFVANPEIRTPDQYFEIIGTLSGMISRRYNDLTTRQGNVERLAPAVEPGSLGVLIDEDYKGKFLPLWRFHLQPNYEA